MPKVSQIEYQDLSLDLKNYRTTPQKNEIDAINAMITIKSERFYAIMESIIDDGYLITENIIILKDNKKLIVKEGNRRIGILKILHGTYKLDEFILPSWLLDKIKKITPAWKEENLTVPCTVYELSEEAVADKIVTLAHGKGEKASRDPWSSVARARHNRAVNGKPEHGLDLLEKYLIHGKNHTKQQRDRWSGDYKITVLDEALKYIYTRFGVLDISDLVSKYPIIPFRSELEEIIKEIGLENVKFETIRKSQDFGLLYGIPQPLTVNPSSTTSTPTISSTTTTTTATTPTSTPGNPTPNNTQTKPTGTKAYSINDPKFVRATLKKFIPQGNKREKVVALRDELFNLNIEKNPLAFCFLLRSIFEISAKIYCGENNINTTKNGKDKTLADILGAVVNHLTNNKTNKAKTNILHGALTQLKTKDGLLSVTSMNQLVHNPKFVVTSSNICTLFGVIYPLLEDMN